MPIRSILVLVQPGEDIEALLDGAVSVAEQFGAHLRVLLLQPDPADVLADYGPVLDGVVLRTENIRQARLLEEAFQGWRHARGLPDRIVDQRLRSLYAHWSCWDGAPVIGLLKQGRLADLIVMTPRHDAVGLSAVLLDVALFDTGRPVLLIPGRIAVPLLTRVAIGWNSSLGAVRSLAACMEFLHAALGVEVLSARIDRADASDPAMISGQDLVEALSWHGISSRAVSQTPLANESAGAAILRDVAALDVSLVVMGAFTQSRVRGVSLGDVTKYMIRHATVPLLMTGS